ncbi:dephospho-CoA kinase [Paraburkholderia acidisoli]|uniref:Dephospho-CoA kinase n=1 Tax=Paraburkholderia acidisoli TaxID=2571748 RepID=A0A7Z2GMM3_9BURK|nr:dephospho-CoA kinase [Paraburkholderia acidisoli]QGZ64592.1 dephospho-CoA kinase [Paraburkholderia acidisoli]
MSRARSLKYCVIAPAGAGKSTVAKLLKEEIERCGLDCEVVKLAEPLYHLQAAFYSAAGIDISRHQQNHPLMEGIADALRTLNPRSIVDDFMRRYHASTASAVVNDDLRDLAVDWPVLRELGFVTIMVHASAQLRAARLAQRGDLKVSATSKLDANVFAIEHDIAIDNDGCSLKELREQVRAIVERDLGQLVSPVLGA